jgi:hypothetical protein
MKSNDLVVFKVDRDILAFARDYSALYQAAHPGAPLDIAQAVINAALLFESSGDAIRCSDHAGNITWCLTRRRRARGNGADANSVV